MTRFSCCFFTWWDTGPWSLSWRLANLVVKINRELTGRKGRFLEAEGKENYSAGNSHGCGKNHTLWAKHRRHRWWIKREKERKKLDKVYYVTCWIWENMLWWGRGGGGDVLLFTWQVLNKYIVGTRRAIRM